MLARLVTSIALAAACFLGGCGPTLFGIEVASASQALEEARQVGAERHAPYEYYLAEAYLEKAREEAGEASYQDAVRFAERAASMGRAARDTARARMQEAGR